MTQQFQRGNAEANRSLIAEWFLKGQGIEVGALHKPQPVPHGVRVTYVDRFTKAQLRQHYPELNELPLVELDIVDNGETLEKFANDSQDFVIASHFLEHCQSPLTTLRSFLRVLKPGGVMFIVLPDKSHTFDVDRPITSFDHVLRDDREGPAWSRRGHFLEWARLVEHLTADEAQRARADQLMQIDYSIHFHVWDKPAMIDLFRKAQSVAGIACELLLFLDNDGEGVFVLSKP